ncbi:transmembrane protein 104-like isoform X2 [Ptychodera flava]|uniref:transmembrane protein 104-like isoform X2 n=1 Tax=Ptychodera flava TaxID=63121 RepID=UPI00396A3707
MAGGLTERGDLYSTQVGFIYIFNLIVGSGALTMPKAFAKAGWLCSLIVLVFLAFMSFLNATFINEVMAAANAVLRWKRQESREDGNDSDTSSSSGSHEDEKRSLLSASGSLSPSINRIPSSSSVQYKYYGEPTPKRKRDYFDITQRVEMGQMASMFFNKVGVNLFYICIIIYLYGDLAIYAAAVPKSLRDVACNSKPNASESDPCWNSKALTRIDAYRIFLACFSCALGPFVFFNVQKTKYLQIVTSLMRWLAFGLMIGIALVLLGEGKGNGNPVLFDFDGMPNLFGVAVYSFMCQHSLPSLVTPIKNKSRLTTLFFCDFSIIMVFYLVLCFTAAFCFDSNDLDDLYTLNFKNSDVTSVKFFQYYLALFPVFTLSTNFPIIAITLRNNLKTLFHKEGRKFPWIVDKILFPMVTILPPIAVAFYTHDLELLVGITGSYAGVGIQYFTPALLVYYARKDLTKYYGHRWENKHMSPFRGKFWVIFVNIWAVACIIFVTVNHIISKS